MSDSDKNAKIIKRLSKKKKAALGIVAAFLALVLGTGVFVSLYIRKQLSMLDNDNNQTTGEQLDFDGAVSDETVFQPINGDIDATGFEEGIRRWATNGGEKMSSKNVLNVLVMGYDSRSGENDGNTDLMMLLSYNAKEKTVTLASLLRDTWVYYETGDGRTGFNKLTSLYNLGGIDCLFQGIENHYKISVDRYVAVNFESFQALVDAMGGIEVPVQKYEANYYNVYYKEYLSYGDSVRLNGKQALGFCRIRKCDSDGDVSRARRHQLVVEAIIKKASEASVLSINSYVSTLLPYIKTNFSDNEILSLGAQAIRGQWYSLPLQQIKVPDEEARRGYAGEKWYWACDFPLAAQTLQTTLYGTSNITLPENRTTLIDLMTR